MSTAEENIKVFCRFRPQNKAERQSNGFVCFSLLNDGTSVILTSTGQNFQFDKVFGWDCPQREVYTYAAKPVIHSILLGYNGTVFAYGQTSSGKTHTMEGDLNDPELQGVIPRMVFSIFDGIFNADESVEFVVKISIVEIYNERIKDLLDPEKYNLKVTKIRPAVSSLGASQSCMSAANAKYSMLCMPAATTGARQSRT